MASCSSSRQYAQPLLYARSAAVLLRTANRISRSVVHALVCTRPHDDLEVLSSFGVVHKPGQTLRVEDGGVAVGDPWLDAKLVAASRRGAQ
eukprot:2041230-Pleurochrysis_carterae.AAC.3